MKLKDFLKLFNARESTIIEYRGVEAKAAVERNGYALRYVKEQTVDICKAAVAQDGDALRYVNKRVFKTEKVPLKKSSKK